MTFLIVFATGAATLVLELAGARMMAPWFGASLFIWTAILSVTLLALAAGYMLGGYLAKGGMNPDRKLAYAAALSGVLTSMSGVIGQAVIPALSPLGVTGSFIASGIFMGPALVALGTISPLAVAARLVRTKAADAGSGAIFAVGTVGSMCGSIGAGLVLLPSMPTEAAMLASGVLCILVAAPHMIKDIRPLTLLLACLVAPAMGAVDALDVQDTVSATTKDGVRVSLTRKETVRTAYGSTAIVDIVAENGLSSRAYTVNGTFQSIEFTDGAPGSSNYAIIDAARRAYAPKARTALVLGVAGGSAIKRMLSDGITVTGVDIDESSFSLAQKYFGLTKSNELTLEAKDARLALQHCAAEYDIILFDVFSSTQMPAHLLSKETMQEARSCLAPGGVVIANVVGPADGKPPFDRILGTFQFGLDLPVASYPAHANGSSITNWTLVATEQEPRPLDIPRYPVSPVKITQARIAPSEHIQVGAPFVDAIAEQDAALAALYSELVHGLPFPPEWL